MRTPGAVVVGAHVNGLGLVRALAARGIATAVIATKPYDIGQHSRLICARESLLELEEEPERLVELLERRAGDWQGWAVLPSNDGALAALSQYRERLAATYRVVAAPAEITPYFLDKERMLKLAVDVGVDLPHCYGPATTATASSPLRFPVVVKPNVGYRFFSRFGCKLFAARDRAELKLCVARLAEAGMPGQIFDLVPGPDSLIYAYCTYVDARGEPGPGVTVRKIRQGPPFFGVARVAEIVPENPLMRDAAIEMVRRIGFRGMAVAEFKHDPRDGRFRFIEINGRSVIYNGLLRRAGLDLASTAWAEHVGEHGEVANPQPWPGVWINLHSDVLHTLLYRRRDPVGLHDFLAPYRRPAIEAVWSAHDPLPFLAEWGRSAAAFLGLGQRARQADR